ncbi:MAG: serine hydrolase [Ginsengibacter sp.]
MKYVILLIGIVTAGAQSYGQEKSLREIRRQVQQVIDTSQGNFAVVFKDLKSNNYFSINGEEVFHAASTMKTPVMMEVFKQVNQGKYALSDSVLINNEFNSIVDGSPFSLDSSSDSDPDLYKYIGSKLTLASLLARMIDMSSNLATNTIIKIIGAGNVNNTMVKLGVKNLKVLRGVEDQKAFDLKLNNVTTADDQLILYESLAKGKFINKHSCRQMIEILSKQKHNEIIPAYLPKNVLVAHKTGSITGVEHDGGIIILPNGHRYILVLLSKNLIDEKTGIEALARISKLIYGYVTN